MLSLTKLDAWLARMESNESDAAMIAYEQLEQQTDFEVYKEAKAKLLEGTIGMAASALKAALVINGGAAVAVLAFLGTLSHDANYGAFPLCLLLFALGVLFASVGSGLAYLVQYNISEGVNGRSSWRGWPVIAVSLSHAAFLAGVTRAWWAFE